MHIAPSFCFALVGLFGGEEFGVPLLDFGVVRVLEHEGQRCDCLIEFTRSHVMIGELQCKR